MNITTKSLLGLALTGVTATGGYFAFSKISKGNSTGNWEEDNKEWLGKWTKFYDNLTKKKKPEAVNKNWKTFVSKLRGDKSFSNYQLAKKFKEWCDSPSPNPAVGTEFKEIKDVGCKLPQELNE